MRSDAGWDANLQYRFPIRNTKTLSLKSVAIEDPCSKQIGLLYLLIGLPLGEF